MNVMENDAGVSVKWNYECKADIKLYIILNVTFIFHCQIPIHSLCKKDLDIEIITIFVLFWTMSISYKKTAEKKLAS